MGTTPSNYPLDSEDLAGLDDIGSTFTSANLRSAMGLSTVFTSDDLLGFTDYVAMSPTISGGGTHRAVGSSNAGDWLYSYPNGGVGPYTYAWEKVSGTTLSNNGTTSGSINLYNSTAGTVKTAAYRCKITDSTGAVAYTPSASLTLYKYLIHHEDLGNVTAFEFYPDDATSSIRYYRDGTTSQTSNWVTPTHSDVGDWFSIAFTASSGTISTSSAGPLTTQRYVTKTVASSGTASVDVLSTITLNPAKWSGNFSWGVYHTLSATVYVEIGMSMSVLEP